MGIGWEVAGNSWIGLSGNRDTQLRNDGSRISRKFGVGNPPRSNLLQKMFGPGGTCDCVCTAYSRLPAAEQLCNPMASGCFNYYVYAMRSDTKKD
jgi:hypothetical protein